MKLTITALIIFSLLVAFLPVPAYGISLVPCGRADQKGTPDEQCTFQHLVILIVRLINYLISVAAVVAMYYILLSGFNLITSVGNPEKIKNAKTGISNAVVGFAIIILAFVFVNLLVNGIFGKPGPERPWWDPKCIYNITGTQECPLRAN